MRAIYASLGTTREPDETAIGFECHSMPRIVNAGRGVSFSVTLELLAGVLQLGMNILYQASTVVDIQHLETVAYRQDRLFFSKGVLEDGRSEEHTSELQ